MSRLTEWSEQPDGIHAIGKENVAVFQVLDKLAAFEDTDLEPSEILALKAENERLRAENAASVDAVEVVHGEWNSLTDCSNAGVYCSVCHKKVWKEDYAWCNRKNKIRSNYCPNCGAKMDGERKMMNLNG